VLEHLGQHADQARFFIVNGDGSQETHLRSRCGQKVWQEHRLSVGWMVNSCILIRSGRKSTRRSVCGYANGSWGCANGFWQALRITTTGWGNHGSGARKLAPAFLPTTRGVESVYTPTISRCGQAVTIGDTSTG
jgi:hypothetical protein